MIKSHMFRGKRWKIVEAPSEMGGECQGPHIKRRKMTIPVHGDTLYDLEVLLHESGHACDWDGSHEKISETAKDQARLLWRLNWRKD